MDEEEGSRIAYWLKHAACVNAIGMEKKTSRLIDRDGQNQRQYVESIKIMIGNANLESFSLENIFPGFNIMEKEV